MAKFMAEQACHQKAECPKSKNDNLGNLLHLNKV